jgi:3-phytase
MVALLAFAAIDVKPIGFTDPVSKDADDPAVWVNQKNPAKSVIFGTNKSKAPDGALVAFDLQGKTLQTVDKIDRPNNCDVEYGLGGMDILVATERLAHRLRIFRIGPTGRLTDISGKTKILKDDEGEASEPMGISLYKRPKDGAIFAIVSPKTGPAKNYLAEYRLTVRKGRVDATLVRRFGAYSGKKEIESIAVDDELGFVYYSDETFGTRKYLADPDAKNADKELALFNTKGFQADHEGIAFWTRKGR